MLRRGFTKQDWKDTLPEDTIILQEMLMAARREIKAVQREVESAKKQHCKLLEKLSEIRQENSYLHLARILGKSREGVSEGVSKDIWRFLLQQTHPDKHNGSEIAKQASAFLNQIKPLE